MAFSYQQDGSGNLAYSREQLTPAPNNEEHQQCLPHTRRTEAQTPGLLTKLKVKLMAKQWRYKPSILLLSVVTGNVKLLANKTDKLAALVRNQKIYRE